MPKDLQGFLKSLDKSHPERLLKVGAPVDPNLFETTALMEHMARRGIERTALFENVKDMRGDDSAFPLLYNLFVTRSHCALALGLPADEDRMALTHEISRREFVEGETVVVPLVEAPVKENVLVGDAADMRMLPVGMHHKLDVGPYLTMICVMKSPVGGFYDMTFTKNMVKNKQKLSISTHPHHHLDSIIKEYEQMQRRVPVVIVLGHHPAFSLSTCCITPYGNDDYKTAGAFLGEPLRLTPSTTWGDEFLVPADAEIIIEGEIPLGVKESQNPFGEILGYYQGEHERPIVEVTAITHRNGAIMQGIFPGHAEHWVLGGLPKEGSTFNSIKKNVAGVKAVHLPNSGCGRVSCYISMKKDFENEPRKAAMQAFIEMPNLKFVVVVDEDVDVYNEREVLWAMTTRTWWDQDLEVIRKVQDFRDWLGTAVAIVDATRPKNRPFPLKNDIPQNVLDRMEFSEILKGLG